MMKLPASARIVLIASACVLCSGAAPNDRRPLREAASENGDKVLRIEPGHPGRNTARPCKATLVDKAGREQMLWEKQLVNEVAPVTALVRNDGRFVVTFDEFRRGGARNALVIYGENGQLLRHFMLTDLLTRDDWRNVRKSRRSIDWLDGAETDLEGPRDELVITLRWGRVIRIDLKSLQLVNEHGERAASSAEVPADMRDLLGDSDDDHQDGPTLDEMAERSGVSVEDLEKLLALGFIKMDEPADADKPLDESPAVAAAEPSSHDADRDSLVELTPEELTADMAPHAQTKSAAQRPPIEAVAAAEPDTPLPGEPTIIVPQPDPANRTDYVEWINTLSPTEGVDSTPEFDASFQKFVAWKGDEDLMAAALAGDPLALASSEIEEWLAANSEALQHFHNASLADRRSYVFTSPDGGMMSILLPNLAYARQLARAQIVTARRLQLEDRPQEAALACVDILAAGGLTSQGPTAIENLVGIAMQAAGTDALLDVLAQDDGRVDYAGLAGQLEHRVHPLGSSEAILQTERAMYLDTAQRSFKLDPSTGKARPDIRALQLAGALVGGGSDEDLVAQARQVLTFAAMRYDRTVNEGNAFYDALIAASALPYQQAKPFFSEAEQIVSTANVNPLLKLVAPSFARIEASRTRAETTRRAATLVSRLLAQQQQSGQLPDTLEPFANRDIAYDPFTQTPFTYERAGDSFRLYSSGENGVDDGGVHDRTGRTNDLVYWPRP